MRKAEIYRNGKLAGLLIEQDQNNYVFRYDDKYFGDDKCPSISLTLTKNQKEYQSKFLFPFFFNLLSEGVNRKLQSRHLQIDENDHFGLLLETARYDTVGAISVKKMEQ